MPLVDELRKELASLDQEIEQLLPVEEELRRKRAERQHMVALIESRTGNVESPIRSRKVNWADICRDNNLYVGGDSAHRVVNRLRPDIHESIPHPCTLKRGANDEK